MSLLICVLLDCLHSHNQILTSSSCVLGFVHFTIVTCYQNYCAVDEVLFRTHQAKIKLCANLVHHIKTRNFGQVCSNGKCCHVISSLAYSLYTICTACHVKVPGYIITSGLESTEELRLRGYRLHYGSLHRCQLTSPASINVSYNFIAILDKPIGWRR